MHRMVCKGIFFAHHLKYFAHHLMFLCLYVLYNCGFVAQIPSCTQKMTILMFAHSNLSAAHINRHLSVKHSNRSGYTFRQSDFFLYTHGTQHPPSLSLIDQPQHNIYFQRQAATHGSPPIPQGSPSHL